MSKQNPSVWIFDKNEGLLIWIFDKNDVILVWIFDKNCMYLVRNIDNQLIKWKTEAYRKPLLLRGARQVGKTSAVKRLGEQFKHFVYINFDENTAYHQLFNQDYSIEEICQQLELLTNTPIHAGETLLFLDEIQSCLPALKSLRYFYEKLPALHVIAAGSLLEFALAELPSFGVGRIRSLFMYPMCFSEFLNAMGENNLCNHLLEHDIKTSLPDSIHDKLIALYKVFLLIGGMPEVVRTYVQNKSLLEVQTILNDLQLSIQDDFAKYKKKVPSSRLIEVFNSVVYQTGNKFSYTYPNATLYARQIKEALQLLEMAGLIYPVTHTSANGVPLGAEINPKKVKYLIYDTGVYQRLLGLDLSSLMLADNIDVINKGNIAELYVGLELIKTADPYVPLSLYYWQRDSRNSQAEVDYVISKENNIYPLEVKSGTKGSMQSMYLFLEEKKRSLGYRLSLENFGVLNQIQIVPLYAVMKLQNK
ncbi:MAG: ATP-binding protein [Bacteroidota bacterium]